MASDDVREQIVEATKSRPRLWLNDEQLSIVMAIYQTELSRQVQRARLEARLDEAMQVLDAYNAFEERREEPSQDLKPGNGYLLDRIAALKAELAALDGEG